MPMTEHLAVAPGVLDDKDHRWRPLRRVETVGAPREIADRFHAQGWPAKLVFAEGDSWFDKFTPIPLPGTNLLWALRTPFDTAVVDWSHIGKQSGEMLHGKPAEQTVAMFKLLPFDAIVLSMGGNDLKNLFADRFAERARQHGGIAPPLDADELHQLATPSAHTAFFDQVIDNIHAFVDLRDAAGDIRTRVAPILLHGYDYFQPRPARSMYFAGTHLGRGPWLYDTLHAAGLNDTQMRSAADAVIDELNRQLAERIAPLGNVFVIDQRGLLRPAAPGSQSPDGDWLDEIHPSGDGFTLLARQRWDVPLARALGWPAAPGETVPAMSPRTPSTAQVEGPPTHA